jgi:hypothetical protein
MRVATTDLINLAESCQAGADALTADWMAAIEALSLACTSLGDSEAAPAVGEAHTKAVKMADELVLGLGSSMVAGVRGLVDTAYDYLSVDEQVSDEMKRHRDGDDDRRHDKHRDGHDGKHGDKHGSGHGGGHGSGHGGGGRG